MKRRALIIGICGPGALALALAACALPSPFAQHAEPSAATNTGGDYAVIYRFPGGDAGEHPGALVYDNDSGALYGTALGATAGVIFRIMPSGDERIVYRFAGGA